MRPFSPAGILQPDLAQEILRRQIEACAIAPEPASASPARRRRSPAIVMRPSSSCRSAMIRDSTRIGFCAAAAEQAGMQVAVGAAHDDLLVDEAAQRRRDERRVLIPHAGVADEDDVRLELVLVGLDPFRQKLRAVLLRALDEERDVDRQRAGHRLPGPAGFEEGHHLALVVAGAARSRSPCGHRAGSRSAARRAASATGRADRRAARRNGRRTGRAACRPSSRGRAPPDVRPSRAAMQRRRAPQARASAIPRPCGNASL